MEKRQHARGFSLVELLIAVVILILLMVAVGEAVRHTLWAEVRHAGRIGSNRSVSELSTRMREEARSSTAVFIPTVDVNGNANNDSHEVDFFRKSSIGSETFVAYVFDSSAGTVTRDEYSTTNGVRSVIHSDVLATGIVGFSALRSSAAAATDVVNGGDVQQVAIQYGHPEVTGGNDIITVTLSSSVAAGLPPQTIEIHIAAKAAPTSLAIVVPAGAPPTPSTIQVIPFVIVGRIVAPSPVPLPHGPINPQDPGQTDNQGAVGGGSRQTAPPVFGSATYYGDGTGLSWLDVSSMDPTMTDGTFSLLSPSGSTATLTVSCGSQSCPLFIPLPLPDSSLAPTGGVVFQGLN